MYLFLLTSWDILVDVSYLSVYGTVDGREKIQ